MIIRSPAAVIYHQPLECNHFHFLQLPSQLNIAGNNPANKVETLKANLEKFEADPALVIERQKAQPPYQALCCEPYLDPNT
jgi:hypothetical protein